jgi:hypothetical protein
MLPMFGIVAAVVGLDCIDSTEMPLLVQHVKQPGAAIDLFSGVRMNPDHMELIARAQIDRIYPGKQILSTQIPPPLQVGVANATPIGIYQMQTTMATQRAIKYFRRHLPESQ